MPHQQQPPGIPPFISLSRAPNVPASRWDQPLPAGKRPPPGPGPAAPRRRHTHHPRGTSRASRLPSPPTAWARPRSPTEPPATPVGVGEQRRAGALREEGAGHGPPSVPPIPGALPGAALAAGRGSGGSGCRGRSVGLCARLCVPPAPSGSQNSSFKWLIALRGTGGGRKGKCWFGIDIPVIYFREKSFKMSSVISHKKSGYTG